MMYHFDLAFAVIVVPIVVPIGSNLCFVFVRVHFARGTRTTTNRLGVAVGHLVGGSTSGEGISTVCELRKKEPAWRKWP